MNTQSGRGGIQRATNEPREKGASLARSMADGRGKRNTRMLAVAAAVGVAGAGAIDAAKGCGGGEWMWAYSPVSYYTYWLPTAVEQASHLMASETSTVRLEQVGILPRLSDSGAVSHIWRGDPGARTFENFRLDEATVLDAFRWQGFCWSPTNPEMNPSASCAEHWTVSIWSDVDGEPGGLLFAETLRAELVAEQYAGDAIHGPRGEEVLVYDYQFTFSEPVMLEADTAYWISVNASTESLTETMFVWASGAACGCELPQNSLALPPVADGSLVRYLASGRTLALETERAMALVGRPLADRDEDGMSDAWEIVHELNPDDPEDGTADSDGDGMINLREFAVGTDPNTVDTDGDGLSDGVENGNGRYDGPMLTGTNPLRKDTDGDGLIDRAENPFDGAIHTDPNKADSDGDGYPDLLEINNGYSPASFYDSPWPVFVGAGEDSLPEGGLVKAALELNDGTTSSGGIPPLLSASAAIDPDGPQSARRAFDGMAGSAGGDWQCSEACEFPAWVAVNFGRPMPLGSFAITSGAGDSSLNPRVWEIQGSHDGIDFTTIYQASLDDATGNVWWDRSETRRFGAGVHFAASEAYPIYRFVCYQTWVANSAGFEIGEIEFYGNEPQGVHDVAMIAVRHEDRSAESVLRWTGRTGVRHAVEISNDLRTWTPAWENIPGAGSGAITEFWDYVPGPENGGSRYYRIRVPEGDELIQRSLDNDPGYIMDRESAYWDDWWWF